MRAHPWRTGWLVYTAVLVVAAIEVLVTDYLFGRPLSEGVQALIHVLGWAVVIAALHWEITRTSMAYAHTIALLASLIEFRDDSTGTHSQDVARWARRLARALRLGVLTTADVETAGLLHDVGKISTPDAILKKPGPLTDDEWAVMRQHVVVSAIIVRLIPLSSPTVVAAVAGHHERYDGSGYPDGLVGARIPLAAQIVGLADTWCALREDRAYRPGLSVEEAVVVLRQIDARGAFRPGLVAAFIAVVDATPTP